MDEQFAKRLDRLETTLYGDNSKPGLRLGIELIKNELREVHNDVQRIQHIVIAIAVPVIAGIILLILQRLTSSP